MNRPGKNRDAAFSLVEVILALAVVTIVLGALGSALLLASRALPGANPGGDRRTQAAAIAREITAMAQLATAISEESATAITFNVPDIDSDGGPDTLRYAWSGSPDFELTKQVNDRAAVVIARDVQQFDLAYFKELVPGSGPPPPVESEEVAFFIYSEGTGGKNKNKPLEHDKWPGQYFKPTLPINTLSWKVTRVHLQMKREGSGPAATDGQFEVQVRPADEEGKPEGVVLDGVVTAESALGDGYAWHPFSFSDAGGLNPYAGACVVVQQLAGDKAAMVRWYEDGSDMLADSSYLETGNSGASWSNHDDKKDCLIYVYGTFTTQGEAVWP